MIREEVKGFDERWEVWVGHHRDHGWVILDRGKNDPRFWTQRPFTKRWKAGVGEPLVFIRCEDWTEGEMPKSQWEAPVTVFAPDYLDSIRDASRREEQERLLRSHMAAAELAFPKAIEEKERAALRRKVENEKRRKEDEERELERRKKLPVAEQMKLVAVHPKDAQVLLLASKYPLRNQGECVTDKGCYSCGTVPPTRTLRVISFDRGGEETRTTVGKKAVRFAPWDWGPSEFGFGPCCFKGLKKGFEQALTLIQDDGQRTMLQQNLDRLRDWIA